MEWFLLPAIVSVHINIPATEGIEPAGWEQPVTENIPAVNVKADIIGVCADTVTPNQTQLKAAGSVDTKAGTNSQVSVKFNDGCQKF